MADINSEPPGDGHLLAEMVGGDGQPTGDGWPSKELKQRVLHLSRQMNGSLSVLRWTWRHLGKYLAHCRWCFREWECGFLRRENAGWVRATFAFLEFTKENPTANKHAVFQALVNMLNGRTDVVERTYGESVSRRLKELMSKVPTGICGAKNFTRDGHLETDRPRLYVDLDEGP
jgi:hypothetical protein